MTPPMLLKAKTGHSSIQLGDLVHVKYASVEQSAGPLTVFGGTQQDRQTLTALTYGWEPDWKHPRTPMEIVIGTR